MPLKKSFKPGLYLRIVTHVAIFTALFSFLWLANPGIAGAGSGPDQVILSWTDDPATTQTIAWQSGNDTAQDQIQYLPAGDFNGSFAGALAATAVETGLYTGYSHFEVTLQGLAPGTSYAYRVGREGAWSEPASFTTADPGRGFSFLYMGDVQQGYEAWGEILQSAFKDNSGLKFGLLGGDLVNDGTCSKEWQQFFAAATPVFRHIPLMPAVGNHDNKPLFWDSFALPRNGPADLEEKFYSFDYGNCHIAVLNSNLMGVSNPFYSEIYNWLRQDLTNSEQHWKFLVFHHPPYPVVFDGRAGNLQENWVPLFEKCGVDVVFVGHQHVYMRTKPLRCGQVQANPQDGIVYIMGNSGTKYYPAGTDEEYTYCIDKQVAYVSNYQVINIDGGVFSLITRDADGQVIDSYMIQKQPIAKAVYTITPAADAAYQTGATVDGSKTMIVNTGVSGLKYFGVQVTPVTAHDGLEAVVFVHLRNGAQNTLNVTKADFDTVHAAQAGFNVLSGDVVKAYIVDDLTNEADFNPTILQ